MDELERLERGARVRLVGDLPVRVEDNPRDGVWILTRYAPASTADGADALRRADRRSEHGLTTMRDAGSSDVLVVVHADDVLDRA